MNSDKIVWSISLYNYVPVYESTLKFYYDLPEKEYGTGYSRTTVYVSLRLRLL